MTATVAPLELSAEPGDSLRLLPISVNLLPGEIMSARAGRSARRGAIGVLLLAVLAVSAWYYTASQANDDAAAQLTSAQDATTAALHGQHTYDDLVTTKGNILAKQGEVAQVTAGDVNWSRLYPAVRHILPAGTKLSGLSGTTAPQTAPVMPAADPTATTGTTPVAVTPTPASTTTGSLVLTGAAPSKPAIALFVERLAHVHGLANPIVTSVSVDNKSNVVDFSITADTTDAALNTRYTKGIK
jgi:hypothetical protein